MIEKSIEKLLFACRWLLAPLYLGLSLALIVLGIKFFQEAFHVLSQVTSLIEADLVLTVLSMIDLVLVGSLIVMVMFSGYENFVSRIDIETGARHAGLAVRSSTPARLKLKVAVSIVAISSIHLLRVFVNAQDTSERQDHVVRDPAPDLRRLRRAARRARPDGLRRAPQALSRGATRQCSPGGAGCVRPAENRPATSTASKRQARLQNSQRTSTSPRSRSSACTSSAAERLQDPGDALARAAALEEHRRALEQADVVLAGTGVAAARRHGRSSSSFGETRRREQAEAPPGVVGLRRAPARAPLAHRHALQQESRPRDRWSAASTSREGSCSERSKYCSRQSASRAVERHDALVAFAALLPARS